MKKLWKVVKIILIVILVLLVIGFAGIKLSGNHRSDPADVKKYETSNPFITGHTQVSAHRSGGGIEPEETMRAFKNCAEQENIHLEVFEFDLHITKDEKLVLLHDDTLDRTSDSEEVFGESNVRPENKTYEELRTLNMGAKFEAEDGSMPYADLTGDEVPDELRILSLEEVLDYLQSMGDYYYIIEIKNGDELGKKGVDILYQMLEERNLIDKVAFGTFHKEISEYVDDAYPDMTRSTSKMEVLEFYLAALTNKKDYEPPCEVLQIPFTEEYLSKGINLATATVVNYAHAHNMALQYWTINDEEDMKYLISLGADCIMSDYPDKLSALLYE